MSKRDGSRLTKGREQLRKEAVDAAAADMTAIFEVLGKATSEQRPFANAPEIVERLPIAELVTKAAGASGIVAVAANLYEKHYTRLEYEATEYDDDGLYRPEPFPPPAFASVEPVGPLIRRRHRDQPPPRTVTSRGGDVLCLRCGLPMSRHQPGQDDEDETPCPDA